MLKISFPFPAKPNKWPLREVKEGECPDCIMPESAQKANKDWVIAHLLREGPAMGFCPEGYSVIRVYPIAERPDLKQVKCCCQYDLFPLPNKLGN